MKALTISLADKIVNDPILFLKSKAERASRDRYLDIARKLFNLDKENNEEG